MSVSEFGAEVDSPGEGSRVRGVAGSAATGAEVACAARRTTSVGMELELRLITTIAETAAIRPTLTSVRCKSTATATLDREFLIDRVGYGREAILFFLLTEVIAFLVSGSRITSDCCLVASTAGAAADCGSIFSGRFSPCGCICCRG